MRKLQQGALLKIPESQSSRILRTEASNLSTLLSAHSSSNYYALDSIMWFHQIFYLQQWFLFHKLLTGGSRHYSHNPRTQIHVEDASRSYGNYEEHYSSCKLCITQSTYACSMILIDCLLYCRLQNLYPVFWTSKCFCQKRYCRTMNTDLR